MLAPLHSTIASTRWLWHIGCLLAGLGLITSTTDALAAEQELGRRHSLLHRQKPAPTTITPADSAPSSTAPAASGPRTLRRKLTKRPGPAATTTPQQNSTPKEYPSPPAPTTPTGHDTRTTAEGTSLTTQPPPSTATTAPVSSALSGTTGTATLSPASLTGTKTSSPTAFAGVGTGGTASSAGGGTTGRSLQHLAGQMPGLSQLLEPTTSASSAPSSSPPTSLVPPPPAGTGNATLSWTLNSEQDLAGYKIYVGTAPGQYNHPGSPIVIGPSNTYTISNLPHGQTYFFAVSAYNQAGGESELSAEVSKSLY
jgi:hypothetical protein